MKWRLICKRVRATDRSVQVLVQVSTRAGQPSPPPSPCLSRKSGWTPTGCLVYRKTSMDSIPSTACLLFLPANLTCSRSLESSSSHSIFNSCDPVNHVEEVVAVTVSCSSQHRLPPIHTIRKAAAGRRSSIIPQSGYQDADKRLRGRDCPRVTKS